MKRKYTRGAETPKALECSIKKCKWQGTTKEASREQVSSYEFNTICPKCGNDEFYGLLEYNLIIKN